MLNKNGKRLLFFAKVADLSILRDVSFYEQDIRALEELGFEVCVTNKLSDLVLKRYDVIYIWWWSYAFLPILLRSFNGAVCIVVGAFHYSTPLMGGTDFVRRSLVYRTLARFALRKADINIFVSKCEFSSVTENLRVSNPKLVYHGIDTEIYSPAVPAVNSPVVKKDFTILCISWLERNNIERKCIREVVQAIRLLAERGLDVKLKLVGRPGPGFDEFCTSVADMVDAGRVELLGHVSQSEKIALLRSSDLYVSPSLYEGFGIAIAEALACGCPVVTSKNGAVPEVVGRCAVFVDPASPTSIASGIERLFFNAPMRARLSILGRKRIVNRFSYARHREQLKLALDLLDNKYWGGK